MERVVLTESMINGTAINELLKPMELIKLIELKELMELTKLIELLEWNSWNNGMEIVGKWY